MMNDAFPKSIWRVRVSYRGVCATFWFPSYDVPSVGRIVQAVATKYHNAIAMSDLDGLTVHSVGVVRGVVFAE